MYFYLHEHWGKKETTDTTAFGSFPSGDVFSTGDRAVFSYTGDTVLVLGPAKPINLQPSWNILYKDNYGIFQKDDFPEGSLQKIEPDTQSQDEE